MKCDGFLLTRQWHEREEDGVSAQDLDFWLATNEGPARIIVTGVESLFFVATSRIQEVRRQLHSLKDWRAAPVKLTTYHSGEPVTACYFASQRLLNLARNRLEQAGVPHYEADIRPTDRYLMERFIRGAVTVEGDAEVIEGVRTFRDPRLSPSNFLPILGILSIDIETSYTEQILYSIAGYGDGGRRVFMVGEGEDDELLTYCPDERTVIERFLAWVWEIDPDVLIGWSVVAFDLSFLERRCEALSIPFALGRQQETVRWRTTSGDRKFATVPGRVVLDGIELLRTATWSFESFSLESVSRELLGIGKKIDDVTNRAAGIQQLFREDKPALARYNLEDCRLVLEIFRVTELLEFAVQRAALTGLDIDRMGASVAAFDYLYLPPLHRAGVVAPVVEEAEVAASPGGWVLESRPGIYSNVLVLDFKSLYPSIIRTFQVDPLGLVRPGDNPVPGFRGASFSRDDALLPGIIATLWQARDEAKASGHSANSQAIKIIMNSFYGVLGTTGCRFFDSRLASSITMRGHEILKTTQEEIERLGYAVIYGDTDSVFVLVGEQAEDPGAVGQQLADHLNSWWRTRINDEFDLVSCLEIEFETCFDRFLMPTVRGSEQGSKKRYAGMMQGDDEPVLVFKGLESVRSDWSPLAREFQRELYRRVFVGEPYEAWLRSLVEAVRGGEHDEELILRKRVRRNLDDYTRNVPPHVRAARIEREHMKSDQEVSWITSGSRWVEYVMTLDGPEPAAFRKGRYDYDFYIDRQLAPIADAVLGFEGTSLAAVTDRQLGLF